MLQSFLLLVIRLYWGWAFFPHRKRQVNGFGEADRILREPRDSVPARQAILAGATECFGGLLLLFGLCSRLISIPLTILLTVAYLTADLDAVKAIFSDPDKFLTADEFLFLFAVVVVFAFGPGKFSIDWLIKRKLAPPSSGELIGSIEQIGLRLFCFVSAWR